jgi:hypothetical protein|nr:MAG TPA: 40S ribosomal protein SA [Caudoviricetes sp.]
MMKFKILELRLFDMKGNDITEVGIRCMKCGWYHSIAQYKWDELKNIQNDMRFVFCKECGKETPHKLEVLHD